MENKKHIQLPSDKQMDTVSPKDLIVYCTIKQYEDWETHETFVSLETISKILKISVPTLRKSIKSLEADGYLEVIPRKGQTSIFKFNPYKTFEGFSDEFLNNTTLDLNEKAYLAALQQYMRLDDGKVGKVSYSNQAISEKINMSVSTIHRIEKRLKQDGYLTIVPNKSRDLETGCSTQTKIFDLCSYGQEIAFILRAHNQQIINLTDNVNTLNEDVDSVKDEMKTIKTRIYQLETATIRIDQLEKENAALRRALHERDHSKSDIIVD